MVFKQGSKYNVYNEWQKKNNALNKNITNLSDLHNLWIDLGYSSSDNGILFGFNDDTQPLNAKISMLLNTKIQGIVAYCPLGIWNIINKNKKE